MQNRAIRFGLMIGALGAAPCLAQTTTASASAPASAASTLPGAQAASGVSKDLRELSTRLSAAILQTKSISSNPFRVVIVCKNLANKTEDMPGRDLTVYLTKLISQLNAAATADRLQFVEPRVAAAPAPAENAAPDGGRAPAAGGPAPKYALSGTLYSMKAAEKTYYVVDFQLTDLATGALVWNGQYEISTLN